MIRETIALSLDRSEGFSSLRTLVVESEFDRRSQDIAVVVEAVRE
jgi:hypothetical protein